MSHAVRGGGRLDGVVGSRGELEVSCRFKFRRWMSGRLFITERFKEAWGSFRWVRSCLVVGSPYKGNGSRVMMMWWSEWVSEMRAPEEGECGCSGCF